MSSSNPTVQITNNLSHAVDIYDVFNPGGTNKQAVPYQYTKLDTIPAGGTKTIQTIRVASQLEASYSGNFSQLSGLYFNQFPMKIMAAIQFSFDDPPPLTFTVSSDDEQAMIQSFLFHRFAMANPDSALTKNLYAALEDGSTKSINDFFAGTKNFQLCTLSSWNAVMTWLQMNTSGWQGPFYLYEQAPNPAPAGYVPVLVGTMNIVSTATENSATLKLCSQDAKGNPVYASNPQTTTIVMNGDGTMGDSDPGNDVTVNLTPVWRNVIQTTMQGGKPVTNYLAGPTVVGTVADKKVVSTQTARQVPGQPADKNKQASFDSIFGKLAQGIGFLVGLLMLGEFGKKIFDSAKSKIDAAREKAKSKEDFEQKENDIKSEADESISSEVKSNSDTFESNSKGVSDNYQEISDTMQKDVLEQSMEDTAEKIQQEMEEQMENGYTPTEDYENAVSEMQDSFKDAKAKIEDGDFSGASKELADASANMNETITESSDSLESWESQSLKESADAVSEASESTDSLDNAQEEYEQEIENESEDSGFDSEGEEWPSVEEIPEI